jgi:hypothetical protein
LLLLFVHIDSGIFSENVLVPLRGDTICGGTAGIRRGLFLSVFFFIFVLIDVSGKMFKQKSIKNQRFSRQRKTSLKK